jgi:hypothetical protein
VAVRDGDAARRFQAAVEAERVAPNPGRANDTPRVRRRDDDDLVLTMTTRRLRYALLGVLALALAAPAADAGGLGSTLGKAAVARLWRQDARNHAKAAVTALAKPRTVHRYTTTAQARREVQAGLTPNTHMTARASVGRPLSARAAQQKYGLPTRPQVRETIALPKGWPARQNAVAGGAATARELTSPKALPGTAIRKVLPLE